MQKQKQQGFISTTIILIIIGIAIVGGGTIYLTKEKTTTCPTDAQKCSDGSYIKRVAPDCEFEECPDINVAENQRDTVNTSIPETTKSIEVTNNSTVCTDSDEGKDYYMKGKTYGTIYAQGPTTRTWEDFCSTKDVVQEYFCKTPTSENSSDVEVTYYRCLNGCVDGACVSDPTANWKTYRNEEYGFEFSHPNKIMFGSSSTLRNVLMVTSQTKSKPAVGLYISLLDKSGEQTLKEFKDLVSRQADKPNIVQEIEIGGNLAIKTSSVRIIVSDSGGGAYSTATVTINTFKNNYFYSFQCSQDGSSFSECDQIISTFKFIE